MNGFSGEVRRFALAAFAIVLAVALATVAFADQLENDIANNAPKDSAGRKVVAYTAGAAGPAVGYWVQPNGNGGNGYQGCDATTASPLRLTINPPTGVTATSPGFNDPSRPRTLTFTACDVANKQNVTFATAAAQAPGDYVVTVTPSDDFGSYDQNNAAFTLRVSAPAVTDTTNPLVSVTVPTAPAGQGGYFNASDGPQTVNVSATDVSGVANLSCTDNGTAISVGGQSGSNPRTGSFQLSSHGTHAIACTATDAASPANSGAASGSTNTGELKIDTSAPQVSCSAADGAWHAANVSIGCTATDTGSGLLAGATPFSLATSVSAGQETATAQTGTQLVTDVSGNSTTAGPIGGNKIDRKAPSTACGSADGVWHDGNVSIGCTAADGGSGLDAGSPSSFDLATTVAAGEETVDAQTGTRMISDAVGNTTTAGPVGGNKVDRKAPEVSCGSADGVWHDGNVSIGCTASDGGAGLDDGDDASFSLSTSVAAGEETDDAQTGTRTVADALGHETTAGPIGGNKVDRKAPEVSCGSADGAWHDSNVSIGCTASDGGAGLDDPADVTFSLSTSVAAGEEDDDAATGTHTVSDALGHDTTAGPIGGNKIDRKGPAVSCGTADGQWHDDNVSIACTASDGGAGLDDAADASFSLSTAVAGGEETDDAQTGTHTVKDALGHEHSAGPIGGNKVDRKDPSVSCGSADGAWHADNVSIGCTASDGGAGLDDAADASFSLSTSVADGEETDDASTGSRTVADALGHEATAGPVGGNKVDRKAPAVSCGSADGLWHADNVSIGCTASDGGSGLDGDSPSAFDLTTSVAAGEETDDAQTGTRTVADALGHEATGGPVGGNKVDRKAPTVACAAPDGQWHDDNVSSECTAGDGGAGLDASSPDTFSLETSVAAGDETDDAQTGSRQIKDALGHEAAAGPVGGNKVDRKDPSVSCGSADGAWHDDNVGIACTASDGGSGLNAGSPATFDLVTTVAAGDETANASTGSRTISDAVDHEVVAGPVGGNKVDRKAPVISCGSADGVWHAANVSIACTASDGGSGLADSADASFSLSTGVAAGQETANAQTGTHSVADAVANAATAGPIGGNKVDKKNPTVNCIVPAPSFVLNQSPALVTAGVADGGSGPLATPVSTGANTGSVGNNTVQVWGADGVGNQSSANCAYSVGYKFAGLAAPINKPNEMNVSKAGQAIPLKWRLLDAYDQPVTTLGAVTVRVSTMSCSLGTTTDQVEEYAAGSSGLQNLGGGYYQFNWKTPTSYANSCKDLSLDLGEGLTRTNLAYVKFTK